MPRAGMTHGLSVPVADSQQQLSTATEATLTFSRDCVAVLLGAGAGTGPVRVTFDGSSPSATNGLAIIVGAQPIYIPLGFHAEGNHQLKALGGAGSTLDVVQLS